VLASRRRPGPPSILSNAIDDDAVKFYREFEFVSLPVATARKAVKVFERRPRCRKALLGLVERAGIAGRRSWQGHRNGPEPERRRVLAGQPDAAD
jgi:hypothetical protein